MSIHASFSFLLFREYTNPLVQRLLAQSVTKVNQSLGDVTNPAMVFTNLDNNLDKMDILFRVSFQYCIYIVLMLYRLAINFVIF